MSKGRVVVAMSGGVDSSVAAALLQEAGYEVIGVTMQIWPAGENRRLGGCCGLEAIEAARRVAYKLGILHYVLDFRDIFARTVMADFCREYGLGRTPNPCIRCNQYIKFGRLLEKAGRLDANYLATGHYARSELSASGYRLLKAVDPAKDQSYFLYTLGQSELQHLLLPIGSLFKTEVRRMAKRMGLPSASRPESQDICFVPDRDYRSFVASYIPVKSGDIVNTTDEVLGKHQGLVRYTVGQRQGLGIASGKRLYVLKIDAANNRVVVGEKERLLTDTLMATRLSWVSGQAPGELTDITAKIRHRSPDAAVTLRLNNGMAEVNFAQPQWAVTPGQSVVFYHGDVVLGGGIIEARN